MAKENDSVLDHERQKQMNKGIVVGQDYTFMMRASDIPSPLGLHGHVKAIYDGWVALEGKEQQETTINLDCVAFFVQGVVNDASEEAL